MAARKIKMAASKEAVQMATGEAYQPTPVKDGKTAMTACLHIILKHTADVFEGIVGIVSEKYGIDKDEMMSVVMDHPRFKDMSSNPVVEDLGYIMDTREAAEAPAAPTAPVTEEKKTKVFKIKPKVPKASADQ